MVNFGPSPWTASNRAIPRYASWGCGMNSIFAGPIPVKIRCCQYLNNMVEQDHRRIKFRTQSMLGFKTFYNARRVLMGVELMQKIVKGQFRLPSRFGQNTSAIWQMVLAS